jgi:hypothetical protein
MGAEPAEDQPDLRSAIEAIKALQTEHGEVPSKMMAAVERMLADAGPQLRLVGRARKVSVSMPEDLTIAVQERVGRGEFSHYVTGAVARQLEVDLLGDLSAVLHGKHGPVPEELLAQARLAWPDAR